MVFPTLSKNLFQTDGNQQWVDICVLRMKSQDNYVIPEWSFNWSEGKPEPSHTINFLASQCFAVQAFPAFGKVSIHLRSKNTDWLTHGLLQKIFIHKTKSKGKAGATCSQVTLSPSRSEQRRKTSSGWLTNFNVWLVNMLHQTGPLVNILMDTWTFWTLYVSMLFL